jgi:nicastrin
MLYHLAYVNDAHEAMPFSHQQVSQAAGCTRLFHSSGSSGCRSDEKSGLKLPLLLILPEDFPRLAGLHKARTQVIAVVSGSLFNATILDTLEATGNLGGVLVLEDSNKPKLDEEGACFSHDVNTPRGDGTPSSELALDGFYSWNPRGNGLMQDDLAIPVSLVSLSERGRVEYRASRNRDHGVDSRPAYFANMLYYFGASEVDSSSCLLWTDRDGSKAPKCLPLGGQSVWGTMGVRDASKPLVMVAAGIDAANLFQDASHGANEAAGSIITLLAAADALSKMHSALESAPKQIGFAFFQAENYGFIGSRRFVADLSDFTCANSVPAGDNGGTPLCLDPLRPSMAFTDLSLDSIDALLTVDQVALGPSSPLVVHSAGDASAAVSEAVLASSDASTGEV